MGDYAPVALLALNDLMVDAKGLDSTDRRVMLSIVRNYGGGPVGLDTIAASISEESWNHRGRL